MLQNPYFRTLKYPPYFIRVQEGEQVWYWTLYPINTSTHLLGAFLLYTIGGYYGGNFTLLCTLFYFTIVTSNCFGSG